MPNYLPQKTHRPLTSPFHPALPFIAIVMLLGAISCSDEDKAGAWDFEDSFPQIVPGACDEVLKANDGRPDVEQIDEETWALNFEPLVKDCAVYSLSLELTPDPDALMQDGGNYRTRASVCNRCEAPQAINFVSDFNLADEPVDELLITAEPEGFPSRLPAAGARLVFGEAPAIDYIAGCGDFPGGEVTQTVEPGPHLAGVKLSRFPLETDMVFSTPGYSSFNVLVGAMMGPPQIQIGSELDMRVFWPRMVPLDAPLDATTAAFGQELCRAHGWENRGPNRAIPPEDFAYDWAAAYWSSPTQHFSLPPELVERLP